MLVIADAGLPIPKEVRRIDLALTKGIPPFIDTVRAVSSELKVESLIVANEMKSKSPKIYEFIMNNFKDIELQSIPHEEFKVMTRKSIAIIRTGEFTPFANVILISGVVF
jgi:D-ribose pyranase